MQIFCHQFGLSYTCGNELKHKVSSAFLFHPPRPPSPAISISSNFPCFQVDDVAMLCLWDYIKWPIVYNICYAHPRFTSIFQFYFEIRFGRYPESGLSQYRRRCSKFCTPILLIQLWFSFLYNSLTVFRKWFFNVKLSTMLLHSRYDNIQHIHWIHWIVFRFMHTIFDLLHIILRNTAVYIDSGNE